MLLLVPLLLPRQLLQLLLVLLLLLQWCLLRAALEVPWLHLLLRL